MAKKSSSSGRTFRRCIIECYVTITGPKKLHKIGSQGQHAFGEVYCLNAQMQPGLRILKDLLKIS
jgi:hypothetical protein